MMIEPISGGMKVAIYIVTLIFLYFIVATFGAKHIDPKIAERITDYLQTIFTILVSYYWGASSKQKIANDTEIDEEAVLAAARLEADRIKAVADAAAKEEEARIKAAMEAAAKLEADRIKAAKEDVINEEAARIRTAEETASAVIRDATIIAQRGEVPVVSEKEVDDDDDPKKDETK